MAQINAAKLIAVEEKTKAMLAKQEYYQSKSVA